MDISTGSWFEYLREEVLTEGLRDIGLPERIVDFIENAMPQAPEKSKMYAGNQWKNWTLNRAYVDRPQKFWVDWMRENFEDEIQVKMVGDERAATGEIVARTITPYRVSRHVGPQPREQYDEETIEQNKKIAFVVQNVKAAIAKPPGTWRKSFMKATKALSKAGTPSEKVEKAKVFLQEFYISEFRRYWNSFDELFSWLNSEPTNYEMIKGEDDLYEAQKIAIEDLNTREDPEQVIHQFEDGSYWYNLDVSSCSVEGERMGHCGGDTRGVLVSLRKRHKGRKASSSYITMTWEAESYAEHQEGLGTLYQIKGRSNDAPPEEMWYHIDWFIKNMKIGTVEEAGEHSNDEEGFREMNDYLSARNRDVIFTGVINEAAIQAAVDEVTNSYEGENSSIDGEVQGPEDHGGHGVHVDMMSNCNLQIDLGWKGFRYGNNEFSATLGPDDGTPDERFETIPENTYGTSGSDFASETEIENIEWDLPGEGEVSWDVRMLTGAQPGWEAGDPDPPATAHLEITIYTAEQEQAADEETGKQNMQYFGDLVKENFEDNYAEIHEKIRSKLAEGGYAAKTAFDREQQGMSEMGLDHWKVYRDGPKLEFWFRRSKRDDNSVLNSGGEVGSVPQAAKMWAYDDTRDGHIDGIYSRMFGSRPAPGRPARIENDDLSRNMARNLEKLYRAKEQPAAGQQQLALGDEYDAPAPALVLAKDSRFIIMPETTHQAEQYPTMLLNWKYEIAVDAKSSPEEVETVKKIVKYFNEHPDMVEEAAEATLRVPLEGIKAVADATKNDVMSGKWPQNAIRNIDSQYGAAHASGSDEWATRKIMIAKWIMENFDQMDEVEKWVAWFKFLKPIKDGRFNIARHGEVEMDDSANLGRPRWWEKEVKDQLKKLGTYGGTVRDYSGVQTQEPLAGTLGEPRAVEESVEQQIDRIDALLSELIEVRRYKMHIELSLETTDKSPIEDYKDAIRACQGVTTVQTISTRRVLERTKVVLSIKFALKGQESRKIYMDQTFLPYIRGISGLEITPAGYTFPAEIEKLREAGLNNALNARNGKPMPSPRMSVQKVAQDWMDGGVMAYDVPMNTQNMGYHVMVPVKELKPYCSRVFRAPGDAFDGGYKNFIKTGPQMPVYVAVGQNGRIKITGNEDDVWYAMKSGLEELPVYFSYQKQV